MSLRTFPALLVLLASCAATSRCDHGAKTQSLEAEVARLKKENRRLEEIVASYVTGRQELAPRKCLAGRLSAVSIEYRLVIIDIGKDRGVRVGDRADRVGGASAATVGVGTLGERWASPSTRFARSGHFASGGSGCLH
ncbi:MAG: hypothetical protein HYY17_15510 [Planctomycetes bacterium]|nr:hypothetical protein [Planctomycetota bacterium]